MKRERFSLMTFNLEKDIRKKTMTLQDTLTLAAEAGLSQIDVMRAGAKSVPEYQAAMTATGVSVYCYISCVSFFAKEAAVCSALERDMAVARDLGAKLFMIVPYYPMVDNRKAKKLGRGPVLEVMVRGFRLAVEMGKKYGLKVCFETTPAEEIRLSGTQDCKHVLDHVPGLGLVFDTANMLPHGDEPLTACEALKEQIVHVHLKDVVLVNAKPSFFPDERAADGRLMQGAVFGQGAIPVRNIYTRLRESGYNGSFAIEYMRPGKKVCSRQEHLTELQKYLSYLEEGDLHHV